MELSILVLKELIDRLFDTLIASKTAITKLCFRFRKQVEIRVGQSRRIWGLGKNLKVAVSCSSHRKLGCVSSRIAVQKQNALSQFVPPFLTQTSQFVCIVRTVYGTTLLKIVNYDYHLTITKQEPGYAPREGQRKV
jgi:hypothetical protein